MLRHGLTAMINIQPDMAVVGEAESGAEALTAFRNLRPDITLMDLQMLDMGGEEAIGAISAEYLRTCGHSGIAAASTEEAVTVLNDASSIVFAMLCALPAVGTQSGFALAQWVHEHHPSVQIVLAGTVDAAAEAASEFCAEGSRLARPYDREEIVERIKSMREKRRQGLLSASVG